MLVAGALDEDGDAKVSNWKGAYGVVESLDKRSI